MYIKKSPIFTHVMKNITFEVETIIDDNNTGFNKRINLENRSLKNSNDLIIGQIFNKNYYKIYYEITIYKSKFKTR